MNTPNNYRMARPPKCLNCKHYIGHVPGYLSHGECAIFNVLVSACGICDRFDAHIEPLTPIEIKEFMREPGDKE